MTWADFFVNDLRSEKLQAYIESMNKKYLELFTLQKSIRDFFNEKDFTEVMTPPLVQNPGMEVHIHPFEVYSKIKNKSLNHFLHTSPEFHMKELLSEGFKNIFTLSYCFRDEPSSTLHRNQFVMLEWYRDQASYLQIMEDLENLIQFCIKCFKDNKISLNPLLSNKSEIEIQKKTIQEIFQEILDFDILEYLEATKLESLIRKQFKDVPIPKEPLTFEDYFFLLFLNKIEPELKNYPFLILYEYPAPLKALSTLKEEDPRVCERFELYAYGIELCNCFQELCDIKEQKIRFSEQAKDKKELYQYSLPEATVLYQALERGLNEPAGIALGVERLLMVLTGFEDPFFTD
jgi:elongation factor P--(R)-beta-lysine ligase